MAKKRQRGNGQGTLFKRNGRKTWTASWYDHTGKRQERSTGTTDKAAAERLLKKWTTDATLRRENVIDARAEAIGKQAQRPIKEQLADWKSALEAKGITQKRVGMVYGRADRLVNECRFQSLATIEPARVHSFIRGMQDDDLAPRTINGYLQAFKQFIGWAMAEGRVAVNPIASVGMVRVVGQTRTRRPLTVEELEWLIHATESGPSYQRLTGPDRAMVYRLATGTGFRAAELGSLTPSSFNLDSDPPTVTVRAAYSKRRRDDVQPIRQDLAELLRPWLAGRDAAAPVAVLPGKLPPMVRADLRRARAAWIRSTESRSERRSRRESDFLAEHDRNGHVVDFHALRATYITMVVKSGAMPKVAQDLARHSDPKLTMNVYTKLGIHDLGGALDRMPSIGPVSPESQPLRATGTDGNATGPQYGQQCESGELRLAATECNHNGPDGTDCPADKATRGTRTPDLSFTKAPLYQLS
jgi:integrase/recombinase XerC